MVVSAFFGVRRGAEVVQMTLDDIITQSDSFWELRVKCQKNDPNGLGQLCVIPHIRALGALSPVRVLQEWIERRTHIGKTCTLSAFLFVTITGKAKGGPVSTDSLRKHVADSFGCGKSSHSLRRGGAQFYARRGADEDATRQQGGWRTADVMRSVCTTLSASEVRTEILTVANFASLEYEIKGKCDALGLTVDDIHGTAASKVATFLAFIESRLPQIDDHVLKISGVGKTLGTLIRHPDETVRHWAVRLRFDIRAEWRAQQERKRIKVSQA